MINPMRAPSRSALWMLPLVLALASPLPACGDDDNVGPNPDAGFNRDKALRACVAADACGAVSFAYAGSYCLETGWDQAFITGTAAIWIDIYECVLAAVPDCSAVEMCFGGGQPLQPCSEITDGYCAGSVRVQCDTAHNTFLHQDCATANQECTMANASLSDLVPKCGLGACTEGVHDAACQEYLLLSCAGGNYEVTDCSAQGMICGDDPQGRKACVGTGAGCPDDFTPTCTDNVLVDCQNRHLRQLDCSLLAGDFTCSTSTSSCVPAGTDCTPGDPELCQGTTIRICVDGSWYPLDCSDLGFTGCSVSAAQGAHCVP